MKALLVIAGVFAALFLLALLQAQVIVFGLSLFHVDSGIWGPYLLASAAEGIVTAGVTIGSSKS